MTPSVPAPTFVLAVLSFWCALVCVAGQARAQVRHNVILLRTSGSDPVTVEALARVSGELEAAGFVIRPLRVGATTDARVAVQTAGSEFAPVAAFAILPGPPAAGGAATAEIWVSDRATGRAVVQRLLVDPRDAERGAAVLAVQAVELLKASLAELWVVGTERQRAGTRATPPVAPPPVAAPPVVPPRPPSRAAPEDRIAPKPSPQTSPETSPETSAGAGRETVQDNQEESWDDSAPASSIGLGVQAGAAMLAHLGVGGFDPTWAPALRLSMALGRAFALRGTGVGLGQSLHTVNTLGTARVRQQLVAAELLGSFRPGQRVQPFGLLTLGAYHVSVTGNASNAEFVDNRESYWSVVAGLGTGLSVALTHHLALTAEVQALTFLPGVAVRLGRDEEIGQLGRPAVLLLAGLMGSL